MIGPGQTGRIDMISLDIGIEDENILDISINNVAQHVFQ